MRHVVFPMKPFHILLKNVAAAVAVSPAVRVQLEKIFPADKVHVIPNGIGIIDRSLAESDFRELHNIPAEAPLVVTLGELKLLKGQRDFVLAANEVVKRVPAVQFVIAGRDNSMDRRFFVAN